VRVSWARIGAFIALTAAFTAPFWWYVGTHRGAPALRAGMYGLMWGPGFAALVVTRVGRFDLGWRWPGARFALIAWAIPIGYVTVAYVVLDANFRRIDRPALAPFGGWLFALCGLPFAIALGLIFSVLRDRTLRLAPVAAMCVAYAVLALIVTS